MAKPWRVLLFTSGLAWTAAPLLAQTNCPATTAIPPFVGSGTANFSPNQSLCLPRLAPVGGSLGPLAFIVQGAEPGDRIDAQGTVYVTSIRGVPGGVDLWRWSPALDGAANANQTLPFRYQGQPDNCGILTNGCANNVGSPTNLGVAPGGGDVDIAVNGPDPSTQVPNLPLVSLTLAPGVTATNSTSRGDSFSPPNVAAALVPGDDRQWIDAMDASTVYMIYHDLATFNIDVQRSTDGGFTYVNGVGEAIDPQTFPAAGDATPTSTANVAAQIRLDHSKCASGGNLYQMFVAPDSVTENVNGNPMRSAYVGVSKDARRGLPVFMFTDHKIFTSPAGSLGATNGLNQIFPALATDGFGFVYAVASDNSNIFFSSSSDQGTTWTAPIQVNSGATVGKANVFPWVAADANGHAVVVWFGANLAGNSNDRSVMEKACADGTNSCWAQWNVYVAETVNGHSATPAFTQVAASDHFIHAGTVSTGGLGGGANRSLADYFQVALDAQHRANITFADDHIASPLCTTQSPGHCADNDPQSFRRGVPYFTYQLKANPNIVTTGACAGTQAEAEDEGDGEDDGHNHMSFVARQSPQNGMLRFHDPTAGLDLRSSNGVQSVGHNGSCVSFSGKAVVGGQTGYQFQFNACDQSASGGIGSFSISVAGPSGFAYQKSANLSSGFVKLNVTL